MRILLLAAALALPLVACSGGDEDKLAEKCKSTCKIDDNHPCYDNGVGPEECAKACRTLVGAVDKDPQYLEGCAECLAGQFTYAIKTDPGCSPTTGGSACCFPGYVIQPKIGDDTSTGWTACVSACIEPDGGVAY